MKVKELIKELKKRDNNEKLLVWGSTNDDGSGWITFEKSDEIEINILKS